MKARKFTSINPVNNSIIQSFNYFTNTELKDTLQRSNEAYLKYRIATQSDKIKKLLRLSDLIEANVDKYAKIITIEMGKPVAQAQAEVKKSAAYCRYYAENAEKLLKPKRVKTEATESYVRFEPIGPILVITPFNFPFWQAFKPSIPTLLLGNTVILRSPDSTPLIGKAITELFFEAGYDQGEFTEILSSHEQTQEIISDPRIQGVSFTGSTYAGIQSFKINQGKIIAGLSGQYLKRNVMELGGLDPFMVLQDANVEKAVDLAIKSRIINCGQICFSAKRFIIHQDIYDQFAQLLVKKVEKIRVGDPSDPSIQMGPLARWDILMKLQQQIDQGKQDGGNILFGGSAISKNVFFPSNWQESEGNFFPPTIMEVQTNNKILLEETFGPLFILIKAKNDQEIIIIANDSRFGLGAVIVTENTQDVKDIVNQVESGMVFVNEVVKSDQRLPSGGIKDSGYGRECGEWGVKSFANFKTVWIQ